MGIPKDMGIVWETYHKGVPLLGVPGITLDSVSQVSCWFSCPSFGSAKCVPSSLENLARGGPASWWVEV